jgi:hypothetical protein
MYKKPEDIISSLLKEDLGIKIVDNTAVNDLEIEIKKDIGVKITPPPVEVTINNPSEKKIQFELNVRNALNGDILIFDHKDIDIVLMVDKKKLVAFPKDLMSEVVYGAESRLMEWMRRNGIIEYDSIQGGNVYGSLEGKMHDSDKRDVVKSTIYQLSEWMQSEAPSGVMIKGHDDMVRDELLIPDKEDSTELGEIPHEEEKGSIRRYGMFDPYLYGKYTY